jgi:hypothetical protein
MKYVPIPVAMLAVGQTVAGGCVERLRVSCCCARASLWCPRSTGTSCTPTMLPARPQTPLAWQRSYERMVHELLSQGMDVQHQPRAHAQRNSGK